MRQHIAYAGGIEPERDEWFLTGTQTAQITPVDAVAGKPRIASPSNGSVFAIDPDIPQARQRVVLSAQGALLGAQFVLDDGQRVRADAPYLWLPPPGRRQIVLLDAAGRERDRVRFEVRGLRPMGTAKGK